MNIETTLCIHDLQKDQIVSKSIWNTGSWKPEILGFFIQAINQNPDSIVLDLGANIGEYTLISWKTLNPRLNYSRWLCQSIIKKNQ